MNVHHFTVGPFLEHTYILSDEKTKEAYIVDPGGENEKVISYLSKHGLRVKALLSTHGHIDHVAGAAELRKQLEVSLWMSAADQYLLDMLPKISSYFGFSSVPIPKIDRSLSHGERLDFGEVEIQVIATPGHTPGGLCYLIGKDIFVGDTLFDGSIGRTDLPGGSYDELIQSIKTKLLVLDENLIVHCGHGPNTTIRKEKKTNPFLTHGTNTSFF